MAEPAAVSASAATRPTIAPDEFFQGMVVQHPNYGLGKVTALSGAGPKRSATVTFASGAGERKFLLIHSQLSPASGGTGQSSGA
jgi:DNA helicase-2/ATP-dependent DNA helicase PcrA